MNYVKSVFKGQNIHLDGNVFDNCTFEDCKLTYSGGAAPAILNCSFGQIQMVFDGAAGNTLAFMTNLYSGGFETFIEATINNIRGDSALNDGIID